MDEHSIYEANGIAVKIVEAKYPKEKDYRLFWIIDQSGCHMAYAEDSLNVHCMNAKEGGSQLSMHDTIYNGRHISITKVVKKSTGVRVSIPRGMIDVLQQSGKNYPVIQILSMKEINLNIFFIAVVMLVTSFQNIIVSLIL